ncbi:MAG: hypothetical protein JWP22_3886 [Ramlibacter sp.]|nr:hypothetical protein [Ramlibacter sp.]
MSHLKVGVRLGLGFALLLALMALAVGVALFGIRTAGEHAGRLERENVGLLNAANAMRVAQLNEAVAVRDFVSLPDVDSQRAALRALKAGEKAFAEAAIDLQTLVKAMHGDAGLLDQASRLQKASAQSTGKVREVLDLADSAEYQQAQNLVYRELRPLQASIAGDLQALVTRSNALAQERAQAARAQAQVSELRLLAVLALAMVLGVIATVLITRGITGPLRVAVEAAERVADGDLSGSGLVGARDETGRVLTALGGMQQRLNALVGRIRHGADDVARASDRIASGNTELAARTEEQAASLEQTAAGVEELTASVKQNSQNAARGRELARVAAELAGTGGEAVGDVVTSMAGIQKSSRRVSDIVALMDELAFQTNLLALNAAVEAARAGAQGRGFAVVAAQVRVLAQRSAEASKDIRQLASESASQADAGAKAAGRAGHTMEKVVSVAREVADVVAEIANASDEQRSGIEQVNTTIEQLDAATQSNAALVQEINTLTETLLSGSRELIESASRFRLAGVASATPVDQHSQRDRSRTALPWHDGLTAPS